MKGIFELKQEYHAAIMAAEALMGPKDHVMTPAEEQAYEAKMAEAEHTNRLVKARERVANIHTVFPNGMPGIGGSVDAPIDTLTAAGFGVGAITMPARLSETRTLEYSTALRTFLSSGGKAIGAELMVGADGQGGYHVPTSELYTRQRGPNGSFPKGGISAALYEGAGGSSDAAGGYTLSVPTEQLIVPLAMPDLGIFDASLVIPTATDVKIPQAVSFGTSALKAESSGTIATFGGTDPALGQLTLSAFMSGALRMVSWELMQDVQAFQQFVVDDLLKGQRILEDQLLATGTGTNQAQGVFGNTGNGTGAAYQLTGAATDGQLLLNSLFDVTSTLRASYQANACWIMSRATGLAIRRAQMQANLFVPVATVDADGTERILGKPVFYDQNAPALPTATSAGVIPILYGDFKQGYIVGVRGGAGINVKILDQPWAAQGQLGILAYRRLDGRIRRSEAIQSVTISHS
jgi:HK97 family phage major capsid protein